jgi:hypothetical protein
MKGSRLQKKCTKTRTEGTVHKYASLNKLLCKIVSILLSNKEKGACKIGTGTIIENVSFQAVTRQIAISKVGLKKVVWWVSSRHM